MSTIGISVIIPNYNGQHLLPLILPAAFVALQKTNLTYEVIVSDDCSTDNSIAFLQHNFTTVKIIESPINKGFSPTANAGIFAAKYQYVLLLNSDVKLTENYFLPLLRYFDKPDTFGVMGKIIGWDEILEGGLAPNAAVMSWTGEQGGIHAAKAKHNVVMTPGGWCYFDHSQTKNEDSITIGSYLPLEKVYGYEPIPESLTEDEAKYIMGAQGNVWTEYMAYPSKIEYMIFPRMSALSEVLWSSKENKSWPSFEKKLLHEFKRYDNFKINYSKAYFNPENN